MCLKWLQNMAAGMASIDAPESGSTRMKIVESLVTGETPSSTISSGVMEWIVMLPAVSGFGVESSLGAYGLEVAHFVAT
jgi:hypothetical protein